MTQFYESPDGTEILRVAMIDRGLVLLQRRFPDPGALVSAEGWTVLDVPDDLPQVFVSQCVRCRRLNFGPCISATCVDLQVRK